MKRPISRSLGWQDKTMELHHLNSTSLSLLLLIPVLLKAKGESHFRFFEKEKNDKVTSHTLTQPANTDRRKCWSVAINFICQTYRPKRLCHRWWRATTLHGNSLRCIAREVVTTKCRGQRWKFISLCHLGYMLHFTVGLKVSWLAKPL